MSQNTSKKLKFVSGWYPFEYFVNRGSYFYGTVNEFEQLHKLKNDARILHYHQTIDAARDKACALMRRAAKDHQGEDFYYYVESISAITDRYGLI